MGCFKKSGAAEALYHLFLFAFTLCCGWLVSALLDAAMAADGAAALRLSGRLAAILAAGLPAVYLWRRALGSVVRDDRQRWREKLYADIISRRIPVDSAGQLDVRLSNDADAVARYYQHSLPSAVENAGIMLGAALLLCRAHLLLGLILFALSLLQFLPAAVYEKWAKEIYEQTSRAEERYDGWLIQGADGLSTLKSYRREDWFLSKLEEISGGMVKAGVRAERTGAVETVVLQLVDGLLRYGSYVIIGLFVWYGGLSVSDTPVLAVLSGYLFGSVDSLLTALQNRFEAQAAKGHLKKCARGAIHPPDGAVMAVSHIQKRYGDKTVLDDISLTVQRGQRVLISGPNGCGKSTLLHILLGILPADSGTVFADTEKTAFALQEEAALTLTGIELLDDLRKENAVDAGKMREYLSGFQLTDEILNKTPAEWSMGQRKKFFLAAAFAKETALLVLDEPANHLDGQALEYLRGLIDRYGGAILAVSHKADMPVKWDRILVLKGGDET